MSTRKIKDTDKCNNCGLQFCEENKHLFEVGFNKLKDGTFKEFVRRSRCKICSTKRRQAYPKSFNTYNSNMDYLRKLKNNHPCKDCGISYPYYIMEFDHVKEMNFRISARASNTRELLNGELKKCDIVCANCHAARTHKRRYN